MKNPMRKQLFALSLTLLAMMSAAIGIRNATTSPYGSQDLQWQPVQRIIQRQNPYAPVLHFTADPTSAENPTFLSQVPNYPVSGYTFLLPLGMMDWETTRIVWVIANLTFTALLIAGLQKLFPIGRLPLLITICLLLTSSSWRITIGNGQHGLFALSFFVWAVVWCEQKTDKKRPLLSAIFLAISLFKYTITAPLAIYFVWKRQWRPLIIAALIHVFLTAAMTLWLHEDFATLIRQPFQVAATVTTIGDYDLFSLSRMVGLNETIPAVLTLIILTSLALIPTVGAKYISPSPLLSLSILALTAYITLFHRSYDLILLIFPLWLIMQPAQSDADQSLSLRRGLRGGFIISFIILAWHGRRLMLAVLSFLPAALADNLYTVLVATLLTMHVTTLLIILKKTALKNN